MTPIIVIIPDHYGYLFYESTRIGEKIVDKTLITVYNT